ncbi:MAG: hypothetical protein RDV48_02980 [Candidatus Eremiobacteraeota bacterium]|nr:hypothetical protein [Candidatus Eremiobacteraeota bacterium]
MSEQGRSDKKAKESDPFTLSEFENLARIIKYLGESVPAKVKFEGDGFSLLDDLVIDRHLSLQGIFTEPYRITNAAAILTIKKGSFSRGKELVTSRIATELAGSFTLEKDDAGEEGLPESLACELAMATTYVERTEDRLLSKGKVFIEKTFHHTSKLTQGEKASTTISRGYRKVNLHTGYVMEEKYDF